MPCADETGGTAQPVGIIIPSNDENIPIYISIETFFRVVFRRVPQLKSQEISVVFEQESPRMSGAGSAFHSLLTFRHEPEVLGSLLEQILNWSSKLFDRSNLSEVGPSDQP